MRLSEVLRGGLAAAALIAGGVLLATAPKAGSVADAAGDARKQPMRFAWHDCQADCRGWISAQGIVTADTPAAFEDFAKGRDLAGATIVLDSSGGSVLDAMTLGRRFRHLGALTSVGATRDADRDGHATVEGTALCESMCVFLLLSGTARYVPDEARVRVHQIWMGDRAEDARGASYTAQDLMIVERDIGRLAKYTFDMGGTGDLLALALSVPPWEDLHEMSAAELRLANLVTTQTRPAALPPVKRPAQVAAAPKPMQERFVSEDVKHADAAEPAARATRTAEATGGNGASTPTK